MKYELDTHSHTLASGHAYSTIREMMHMAAERGLKLLAITEHAKKMPGTCGDLYFRNLHMVPDSYFGVELLAGAEVNIMDYEGRLDMSDALMSKMDIVIASMHMPCIKSGSRQENTQAFIRAMQNPYVNIIGHPDDDRYPVDMEALVQAAGEYKKVLELNNHSLEPSCSRQNAWENDRLMLEYCKKYEVFITVGSDAHVDVEVGRHDRAYELLEKIGFPEQLVLNSEVNLLKKHVNRYILK